MNKENNEKKKNPISKFNTFYSNEKSTSNVSTSFNCADSTKDNMARTTHTYGNINNSTTKKGKNLHDVKKGNYSLVLKLICTGQCKSRMDISCKTGLTKMTVTNIIQQLLSDNIVSEGELSTAKSVGRKPVMIFPKENTKFSIGVYIARDEITISLLSLSARIVIKKTIPLTIKETQETLLQKITQGINIIKKDVDIKKIIGIGVACIGPLDLENGVLLSPTDFYGIENVPLKQILEDWSSLPVIVNNDMNAAALAEQLYGDGVGSDHFIYFGITHGVGSGIIANGKLFSGSKGYGGEIGHVSVQSDGPMCSCGNRGCLEVYASMPVFLKKIKHEAVIEDHKIIQSIDDFHFWDLISLAIANDAFAVRKVEELSFIVSTALINAIHILNSSKIFIGHESAQGGEWFAKKIEEQLNRRSMFRKTSVITVGISKFKDHSPIVGSGVLVFDQLFQGNL